MLIQHFVVEGKPMGSHMLPMKVNGSGQLYEPFSSAWFCPYCADIWARAFITGGDRESKRFKVFEHPCRRHLQDLNYESRFGVPGSLIPWQQPELQDTFPPEVWQWEFLRHADWWEHFNTGVNSND